MRQVNFRDLRSALHIRRIGGKLRKHHTISRQKAVSLFPKVQSRPGFLISFKNETRAAFYLKKTTRITWYKKWQWFAISSCTAPQTFKYNYVTYSAKWCIADLKKQKYWNQDISISANSSYSFCTTNPQNLRKVAILNYLKHFFQYACYHGQRL